MSWSALIVDDEPLAREGLRMWLQADQEVGRIAEARNGDEAVEAILAKRPDLVFLDVQMPRMDGFAVVNAIGPMRMPPVVFVTAHDQYAVRAFEINAIDYLLKPVTSERFHSAFTRAKSRLRGPAPQDAHRQLLALLESMAAPRDPLRRLTVRNGDRTLFVETGSIDWIAAAENYVELHTASGSHLLHVPLQTLASSLDPRRFIRVHRSVIVNVDRIKEIRTSTHGQYWIELYSGARVQSGRTYGERMKKLLTNPF